jgi:DNA-binding transcriptional LysR family regulator
MNITFRQMRLFLALVDSGSVTAAARAMHVTQPTASMQLKEIAQSVGQPIYQVVGRKIQLTDVGRELAETARAIGQHWDAFEQHVDAIKGLTRGKLRVAIVNTAEYFMPRLIGRFCTSHPAIDVSLQILNRDHVVQRLRENLDDLYIMSMPPADLSLESIVLMANPIVVVARNADPIARAAQAAPLALADLSKQRFILREKGSGTRMSIDRHFRQQRFRPDVRLELGSNEAVKEAVAGGLGVGILSRHALHGLQREHGVRVIDVAGFPLPSAWHIVHPAGRKLSPVAAAFRDHLVNAAKSGSKMAITP